MVTGNERKLDYPLNRSLVEEATISDTSLVTLNPDAIFPADSDERIPVVMNLSLNEYMAIASSIDVGRDVAYGEGSIEIWWIWSRVLMELCQGVLNCIQTDADVINALIDIYNYLQTPDPNSAMSGVIQGTDVIGGQGSPSCDNDKLFGAITGEVDLMNNMAMDVIEILVASVNQMARTGDMIEAIPVIGVLPFDDILQFSESFLDDMQQNYDASYTVALRDEYRCDLFCIAKDTCSLTFYQIADYFAQRLVAEIFTLDLEDFVEYFTQGTFSGSELVDAWHTFVAGIMLFGAEILNIDSARMLLMVSALYNDPDSDWSILCDCQDCPAIEWTYVWDFTISNGQFSACDANGAFNNGYGLYTAGLGWGSTDVTNKKHTVYLRSKDMTPVTDGILEYEVFWTIIPDGAASASFREPDTTNWQFGENWDGNPPAVLSRRWDFCAAKDGQIDNILRLLSFQQNDVTNDRYLGYITMIKIYGTGANPTGFLGGSFE